MLNKNSVINPCLSILRLAAYMLMLWTNLDNKYKEEETIRNAIITKNIILQLFEKFVEKPMNLKWAG